MTVVFGVVVLRFLMIMYGVVPPVNASSIDTGIVLVMFGNTFATGFELLYTVLLHISGVAV